MHTLVRQPGRGSATRPRCEQVGISAPQGCGKTTLVGELEKLLTGEGLTAASVSIDDFYLRRADLLDRAAASPANALLQGRGNAGTHDLALGTKTLTDLHARTCAPTPPGPSPLSLRSNSTHARSAGRAVSPPSVGSPCGLRSLYAPPDAAAFSVVPACIERIRQPSVWNTVRAHRTAQLAATCVPFPSAHPGAVSGTAPTQARAVVCMYARPQPHACATPQRRASTSRTPHAPAPVCRAGVR